MIRVAKDEFYRAIGGPENMHPTSERDRAYGKTRCPATWSASVSLGM